MTKYDCCVIGAGTFGTKLAKHLKQRGHDTIATYHDPDHLDELDLHETTTDNTHASNQSRVTRLSVRPEQVPATLDELDEPGVLANYTPATFTQYNPIHVASTPPKDNTLHYIGYDDTTTTPRHTSRFKDIIGATANHIEQVNNHATKLARMAQLYVTTLAYTNKLSLSDTQQDAFLRPHQRRSVDNDITRRLTRRGRYERWLHSNNTRNHSGNHRTPTTPENKAQEGIR